MARLVSTLNRKLQTLNRKRETPPGNNKRPLYQAPRVLTLLLCLPPSPPCFCRPFDFLPHSLSCSASVWLFRTDDGRDTTRHLGYIRDPSVPCESRPLCLLSIAALTTGAHVCAGPAGYEIDPKTHATGQQGVLAAHHALPHSFAQAVVRMPSLIPSPKPWCVCPPSFLRASRGAFAHTRRCAWASLPAKFSQIYT